MRITFLISFTLLLTRPATAGQQPPRDPLTLERAIQTAIANYPAIRAAQAQVSVAVAGVELSRTAYLPKTDPFLPQTVRRATTSSGCSFRNP